jgi:hypothetical protein
LTIFIEDLAGVRSRKVAARRDDASILAKEFDIGWSGGLSPIEGMGNNYPPPNLNYLAEILLIKAQVEREEMKEKMRWLKVQLLRWCVVNYDPGLDWAFIARDGWQSDFINCMGDDFEEMWEMMKDMVEVP